MTDTNVTNDPKPAEQATPPEAVKTGKTYSEAELEQILKDRLDRAKAKEAKSVAEAAAKAEAEAAAKQGEFEKQAKLYQAKAAELEATLKQRDLAERKRAIGVKVGLPEALTARLLGESDEEIEKDAKSLLETLPKPLRPQPGPVNPGSGGGPVKKSDTERHNEIYGQAADPWNPEMLRQKGGGAYLPVSDKEM